ncbi:MAG: hypothetical protein KBD94_05000 [Pyrinomonadaceae bacterium]|nr:hypothetical protein [Pyrinomonadaceae bacterium]
MKKLYILVLIVIVGTSAAEVAAQPAPPTDFRQIVERIFEKEYKLEFETVCPITTDWVAARIFREYGAVFVAKGGVMLPPRCIYASDAQLDKLHGDLDKQTETIDGVTITLQRPAMAALLEARKDAAKRRLRISPRGGPTAAARNYATTVALWKSRVDPGLRAWQRRGRIKPTDALAAAQMPTRRQVEQVLAWEQEGIFFSTDLSKSIMYSVAIPGASQHNFMLALDVAQFGNANVRQIMADNGWFQTVKSDAPHFTYLGLEECELPQYGLKDVIVGGQKFWIPAIAK